MSQRPLHPARAVGRHVALLISSLFFVIPFVWMLSLSIKPPNEIFDASFSLFPSQFWGLENYRTALSSVPLLKFMLNGVIVCAGIFALQVLFAVPAAYALAKLRFRGRDVLFGMVLVGLLIPSQVLAIPHYLMLWQGGLLDTYWALILPKIISVFGIFLMRQFFMTVPDDLMHAARIDGLGEFAIVWRVMLPIALPALVAFGIFSVAAHWNDLFWPLIVIQSEELATPPLGTVFFRNEEAGSDFGPLMAGAALIIAPLVIAFVIAQRWFIEGITFSGMK